MKGAKGMKGVKGEMGGKEGKRTQWNIERRRNGGASITLKAVRDKPAPVLICPFRFPSPRCHGFYGVLAIIRTFHPRSTFASQPLTPLCSVPSFVFER